MKVQNPHDKFFKETFSNLEVARDFMQNYLPEPVLKIVDLQTFMRYVFNAGPQLTKNGRLQCQAHLI